MMNGRSWCGGPWVLGAWQRVFPLLAALNACSSDEGANGHEPAQPSKGALCSRPGPSLSAVRRGRLGPPVGLVRPC